MLQNKYLPQYHFNEKHSIVINRPASEIWPIIVRLDFSGSRLTRFLMALRGMPAKMANIETMNRYRFIRMEEIAGKELIIGLIGQFWRPGGNLQVFHPEEFVSFDTSGFAKASWNFRLVEKTTVSTKVETETRIWCANEKALKRFSRYWFFVQPFSGIIRKEILRGIKKKAEGLTRLTGNL